MKRMVKIGLSSFSGGLGFALLGVAMLLFQAGMEGLLLALPIAIISIGGIIAVTGIIMLTGRLMARKSPAFAKEIADHDKDVDILENDERNIAITRKASTTAHNIARWLDTPLIIFLIVMQAELMVTLVFLAAMMAKTIMYALLRHKYNKEM